MTDKIKLSILVLSLILLTGCNKKVDRSDLVINEVMVVNESSYTDDFGERYAWIEIYNNTGEVLFSDGLCIGVVHSTTTYQPTPWVRPEMSFISLACTHLPSCGMAAFS